LISPLTGKLMNNRVNGMVMS